MLRLLSGLTGWAKWAAIGAVVVAVMAPLVAGVLYVRNSEQAKVDLIATRQDLADETNKRVAADLRARENGAAFENCLLANEANAAAAEAQRLRAINAETRLAIAEAEGRFQEREFEREGEQFAGRGLDCPAFDDAFAQWLLDDT